MGFVRDDIEHQLHDMRGLTDPGVFPLRQAAALGRHHTQQRYERVEEEVQRLLDAYLEEKNEVNE